MGTRSRGEMSIRGLFGVQDLGLANPESNLDRVVQTFVSIGQAMATRWIELPKSILLFQTVPDDPASGAIYLYDRAQEYFYILTFDGAEDNLTLAEFGEIVSEYRLIEWALKAVFSKPHLTPAATD
jgi:hypothetical protein